MKNSISVMNSHDTRSSPDGSATNDDELCDDKLIIEGDPHQKSFKYENEERIHGNCSRRNMLGFSYSIVLQVRQNLKSNKIIKAVSLLVFIPFIDSILHREKNYIPIKK